MKNSDRYLEIVEWSEEDIWRQQCGGGLKDWMVMK